MKSLRAISVLLAIAVSMAGCFEKKETAANSAAGGGETIKVGEIGSMTGSEATFGESTHRGIMLAINEINSAGGLNGKKLELISLDNQGKDDETANATSKLVSQEKVVALLGEVASKRSQIMAPIAQQGKVPMISPSSTNPKVTEVGDYVFRVCFIDPFQGEVMAKFAINDLKAKKVAVLRDIANSYSEGLANAFIESYKKLGGEIVIDKGFSSGDVDFKSQLTAIRAKNPDAIFVPAYYTDVGLIARQTRELGMKAPLLGGDGWDSPKLKEIGGKAIDGSYYSNHYSAEDKSAVVQDFIKRYKDAYKNETPDGLAAMGYDAANVLFDSMKRAKSLGGDDLKTAIAELKDFQGVTGKITLDAARNAQKSAVVLKMVDGEARYQTTITP